MGVLLGEVHPTEQERLNNLVPQRGLNAANSVIPSPEALKSTKLAFIQQKHKKPALYTNIQVWLY